MHDSIATADLGREGVFERLLDRLPQGILLVDRELGIAYANPAAARLLGRDSLGRGQPLVDVSPDLPLREIAEGLFAEKTLGTTHVVAIAGRTLSVEGLTAGSASTLILTIEDVTDREARQYMERQFVENAAHELRTPLAVIVSAIDVLDSGAKDTPARDQFLANIRVQSDRLTRLAMSLLVLARLQAGLEQPQIELVEVADTLADVAAGLDPHPGVKVDVDARADVGVLANRELLYRILDNLARNAVNHTREGTIALQAHDLGERVEIEISDTGAGMEPHDVAHAFDRFYRGGGKKEGFGLGLPIAREAAQAMGGTLVLESSAGAGTRARLRLPSARLS